MAYTNHRFYKADTFYLAVDKICVEVDDCFCEASVEIFQSFSCLTLKNDFSMFDVDKRVRLFSIYHANFYNDDRGTIRGQLESYIHHVGIHSSFSTCINLKCLAAKMVETGKHLVFTLIYKLTQLALINIIGLNHIS
jgi:hypothetical protein